MRFWRKSALPDIWIINASPSIILGRIGRLELLEALNATVRVPVAVIREIQAGLADDPHAATTLAWAEQRRLADGPVSGGIAMWGLGAGESQVLSRCLDSAGLAILDDLAARRCAKAHQIPVMGTLGVLLSAKRAGLIPLARPLVEQAVRAGLYLDARLVAGALAAIGE
jgi:predicted nucleic acid-binding protein